MGSGGTGEVHFICSREAVRSTRRKGGRRAEDWRVGEMWDGRSWEPQRTSRIWCGRAWRRCGGRLGDGRWGTAFRGPRRTSRELCCRLFSVGGAAEQEKTRSELCKAGERAGETEEGWGVKKGVTEHVRDWLQESEHAAHQNVPSLRPCV